MHERSTPMNRLPVIALAILLLAASTWIVVAAANDLSLAWWSVDSGGGESAGGVYQLFSTLGQAEAGVVAAGGAYTLRGGVAGKANPNELSLSWWSVNSGGGESAGGTYQLFSMLGQPETGVAAGGNFTLSGGIIGQVDPILLAHYLPLITR